MIRVFLTGISGVGKSTLIAELAALGNRAIDLDGDEWSHWERADPDEDHAVSGTPVEPDRDWVWREDRVRDLLESDDAEVLFVSGCASNMTLFRASFDHVILLIAPAPVIVRRLRTRTTNEYGKRPEEEARVLSLIDTVEVLLRRSADRIIDTTRQISATVAEILKVAAG